MQLLGDRIIMEEDPRVESIGDIIIPDAFAQNLKNVKTGKVLLVGPGNKISPKMLVSPGDRIVINKGCESYIDPYLLNMEKEKKIVILRATDVFAVL